jgi:hypothetical protein
VLQIRSDFKQRKMHSGSRTKLLRYDGICACVPVGGGISCSSLVSAFGLKGLAKVHAQKREVLILVQLM